MKKTYIIPEISVVSTIQQQHILANSLHIDSSKSGSNALVKDGSWDDMWEDDADSDDSFDF